MIPLLLAAAFFCGIHFVISGTRLRGRLVERLGEKAFRTGFSMISLLGLVWLIFAYKHAPYLATWGKLAWFKPVAALFMLLAFVLGVAGITTPNPTVVGREGLLKGPEPACGILRITRHPFLWGIAVWATVHVIANGDWASLILFGSLLGLALVGTRSIDVKRRSACGEAWDPFASATSNVPFLAIAQGRNRWDLKEIGIWRPLLALLLYLAMLYFHAQLFGVSPLA